MDFFGVSKLGTPEILPIAEIPWVYDHTVSPLPLMDVGQNGRPRGPQMFV